MKNMRRLASVLLAIVMVLAMTVTALATTYIVTINNDTDGYSYTAYQIFKGNAGTVTVGNTTTPALLSIEWGDDIDITDADLLAALTTAYGTTVASEIAERIVTQADAEAFAKIVNDYLIANSGTNASYSNGSYIITGLDAGYYLIINTDVPTGCDYSSDIMINVVENTTVNPKVESPESDKTVSDINDSETTTYTDGLTSADHDIGDQVPFTLTATLPGNYGAYNTYLLVFHDVMDVGLTFNPSSVVVSVTTNGTTTVVSGGYVVATATQGTLRDTACTFEVQIADTNYLYDASGNLITVTADSVITVNYTAELNEDAVIGDPGNANTSHIEYSNRPDWDGTGEEPTGETPPETVVVFTYKLTVDKVELDDSGNTSALDGAGFTLYKYDASAGDWVQVGSEITTGTTFTWSGLDDGDYMLVETTTPNGYNTMSNLYFTIEATHTENGITELAVKDAQGNVISGSGLTFTATASSGAVATSIVNEKGTNLPGTGGIGTTIFYIVGGVMVLGAAVILITKRRMSRSK